MKNGVWIALCIAAILSSFILTVISPLTGDEELYAIAIKDVQKYGVMPYATYFGSPMFWKPPITFAVYGIMTAPFAGLLPDTVLLRMPSLIFIALSVVLFYLFTKGELKEDKRKLAVLLLLISVPVFGFGSRLLTDTLAFFFLMLMLYCVKQFMENEKTPAWILGACISIIGVGLSKSFTISLFAFLLALGYFALTEKKKTPKIFMGIVLGGIVALIVIGAYPLIALQPYTEKAYFSYLTDTARTIVPYEIIDKIYLLSIVFISYITPIGIAAVLIGIYSILKDRKLEFYALWGVGSLIMLGSMAILPWYFIFFAPAFAILVAKFEWDTNLKKVIFALIVLSTLALSVYIPFKVYGVSEDGMQINDYIRGLGENKVLIITRDGQGQANAAYGLKYACVVTPEINMATYNFKTRKMTLIGQLENFSKRENIRGIVYNYNDRNLYPQFVDQLDINFSYIPPVARTPKNFDGDFNIIIVKSNYYDAVRGALPEYKEINRTENSEYYVFGKK